MEPSSLGSSYVKWMFASTELMCSRKASLSAFWMIVKVSSTNLFQILGVDGAVGRDFVSRSPKIWKRFVDDTFTIIQKADKDAFLEHINSVDANIHFTYEDPKEDGSIPFLDMLIIPD